MNDTVIHLQIEELFIPNLMDHKISNFTKGELGIIGNNDVGRIWLNSKDAIRLYLKVWFDSLKIFS